MMINYNGYFRSFRICNLITTQFPVKVVCVQIFTPPLFACLFIRSQDGHQLGYIKKISKSNQKFFLIILLVKWVFCVNRLELNCFP